MSGNPDWRIWLGLSFSLAWLILGAAYISQSIGWQNLGYLPANDLGSFLEGAFAPLAFLWLVIGYFLQQKELQQNTRALLAQAEEIHRTAEQAVIQSQKMSESEVHARQDTFLQIVQSVRGQLGQISGFLFISSQGTGAGPGENDAVSPEEVSELFRRQSSQEPEVFSRRLLQLHIRLNNDKAQQYDLFYGTTTRARHSNNFIFVFERLMKRAEEVDPDNMIRDSLLTSGHGFVYAMAKRHQANAPPELANHQATGLYIDI